MTAHWVHSKNFLFAAFLFSIALGGVASFHRQQGMLVGSPLENVMPSARPALPLSPGDRLRATPLYRQFKNACDLGYCREACRLYHALNCGHKLTVEQQAICRDDLEQLGECPMR
jgi:hypothetical protein